MPRCNLRGPAAPSRTGKRLVVAARAAAMIEVYAHARTHPSRTPMFRAFAEPCAPPTAGSICNDRLGKKIRVKCNPDDTVGDLKKLLAAQTGTRPEKLRIQKWYTVYKDHITLEDYEIHDGMGLELYCALAAAQARTHGHGLPFFCFL